MLRVVQALPPGRRGTTRSSPELTSTLLGAPLPSKLLRCLTHARVQFGLRLQNCVVFRYMWRHASCVHPMRGCRRRLPHVDAQHLDLKPDSRNKPAALVPSSSGSTPDLWMLLGYIIARQGRSLLGVCEMAPEVVPSVIRPSPLRQLLRRTNYAINNAGIA